MAKGRFEPGAVCIVIGEHPGYERNIGALITLVDYTVGQTWSSFSAGWVDGVGTWTFRDASRPILVAREPDHLVLDSTPFYIGGGFNMVPAFTPKLLLPIDTDDYDESLWSTKPLANEEPLKGLPSLAEHIWP